MTFIIMMAKAVMLIALAVIAFGALAIFLGFRTGGHTRRCKLQNLAVASLSVHYSLRRLLRLPQKSSAVNVSHSRAAPAAPARTQLNDEDHARGGAGEGDIAASRGKKHNPDQSKKFKPRRDGGQHRAAPRFAALDLGTNNCRLLIAAPRGRDLRIIDAFSQIVRLGEGAFANGSFVQCRNGANDRRAQTMR